MNRRIDAAGENYRHLLQEQLELDNSDRKSLSSFPEVTRILNSFAAILWKNPLNFISKPSALSTSSSSASSPEKEIDNTHTHPKLLLVLALLATGKTSKIASSAIAGSTQLERDFCNSDRNSSSFFFCEVTKIQNSFAVILRQNPFNFITKPSSLQSSTSASPPLCAVDLHLLLLLLAAREGASNGECRSSSVRSMEIS